MKYILVLIIIYGCDCRPAIIQYPNKAACEKARIEALRQPKAVGTTVGYCLPG